MNTDNTISGLRRKKNAFNQLMADTTGMSMITDEAGVTERNLIKGSHRAEGEESSRNIFGRSLMKVAEETANYDSKTMERVG